MASIQDGSGPVATGLITKRSVDALAPGPKDVILWDAGDGSVKGFGCKCTPAGRKVYFYQFRLAGGRTRAMIGVHGQITPDRARVEAKKRAHEVATGSDPNETKRAKKAQRVDEAALRFDLYADQYLARLEAESELKPRSIGFYRDALRCHVVPVFKSKSLAKLTRADFTRVLDKVPAHQRAVRLSVFRTMSGLLKDAVERGDIKAHPMTGMAVPMRVDDRKEALNDSELALLLRAAAALAEPLRGLYELLVATGARREEVSAMDWAEIDREAGVWTLPVQRSKNRSAQKRPVNRFAISILDRIASGSEWPASGRVLQGRGGAALTGYSKAKAQLVAAMLKAARQDAIGADNDPEQVALKPFRIHDIRRSFAVKLQKIGTPSGAIEGLLGHFNSGQRGIARVYQVHDFAPEMRIAADAWGLHLQGLIDPPPAVGGVVVPFERPDRAAG